jgi:hypothetical protein
MSGGGIAEEIIGMAEVSIYINRLFVLYVNMYV